METSKVSVIDNGSLKQSQAICRLFDDFAHDPSELRKLEALVASSRGDVELISIKHPWPYGKKDYRLVPGRVLFFDSVHEVEELFTFGGSLHINVNLDQTICTLRSPVLLAASGKVGTLTNFSTWLAEEVEDLLATRHAAWLPDENGYYRRLANLQPDTFYCSSLKTLSHHLEDRHLTTYYKKYHHRLMEVIHELHNSVRWPSYVPSLKELI